MEDELLCQLYRLMERSSSSTRVVILLVQQNEKKMLGWEEPWCLK
jgi:hypothetical protein